MQHTEASAGLLSLAAPTSDAEGWLMPAPASRQERLSEQASLVLANLLAQAAPGTSDWLASEPADPLAPLQQSTAAGPSVATQQRQQQGSRQQRRLISEKSEVQPLPRASLPGQQSHSQRRSSTMAAPQPRQGSAVPRPASAMPRAAPKSAVAAASPRPLWRHSGNAQTSPVTTPRPSTSGTRKRQSLAGTPPSVLTAAAHAPVGASTPAQRPASAVAKQALKPEELSPSSKVAQWLFSPTHRAVPSGRLTVKRPASGAAAAAAGTLPSPSVASSEASWRIAAAANPSSLASPAGTPAAAAASGFRSLASGSRIPRPGAAPRAAAPAVPAVPLPTEATSPTARAAAPSPLPSHRSGQALKQLAQRALAAGSGSTSPPAPRPGHLRRPSSLLGASQVPVSSSQPSSQLSSPLQQTFVSVSSTEAASVSSYLSAAESPAGSETTPRNPHRLPSSSSQPASPAAPGLTPHPGSAGRQLRRAQAAAGSSLAAAKAGTRAAAEEAALLSAASSGAWAAAQAVAAASPASGASLLDAQLAQLERLSCALSDASSQIAEVCMLETLAKSRRASSSTAARRLSLHSPGASSARASSAGTASRPRSLAGSLASLSPLS